MSASLISTVNLISHRATIFLGIPILIAGLIGGVLIILVFLSLQTFRLSSCACYLTIMAMVSIGSMITGLLSYIMIYGFGIDWTGQSRFYCVIRQGFVHIFLLTGLTCLCLATIDQYLATCSSPRWQRFCNVKLARWLCLTFTVGWCLYGILFFLSNDLILLSGTLQCLVVNNTFQQYFQTFHVLVLLGVLPLSITVIFGCSALRNVQQLSYRTLPLVRRELDKQLTVMVLTQVLFNFCAITPYTIINAIILCPFIMQNSGANYIVGCARSLSILLFYSCFASPFYIYICVSERFRHQLAHVLFKIHRNRCRHRNVVIDLVVPQH